jgi:pyruvate formate lyase activating enzyme
MNIRGIHKTSLIDYPGRISSVIFTGGCNLRCGYCHNPELACNSCELERYSNEETLGMIQKRRGLIDGITISGGEPTIAKNITTFMGSLKGMDLAVKLDTNGLSPNVVKGLVRDRLVDYVAIDIKTAPEKYEFVTGMKVDFDRIVETVDVVRGAGIDYELRTTCMPYYVTLEDFKSIRLALGKVSRYFLQQFVNDVTLDSRLGRVRPYAPSVLQGFRKYVETFADLCEIRGI